MHSRIRWIRCIDGCIGRHIGRCIHTHTHTYIYIYIYIYYCVYIDRCRDVIDNCIDLNCVVEREMHILFDCIHKGLFSALKQTHCTVARLTALLSNAVWKEWLAFYSVFWVSTKVVTVLYMVVTLLVPHETAAVSAHVLCTPYNHAPVYSVTLFEPT